MLTNTECLIPALHLEFLLGVFENQRFTAAHALILVEVDGSTNMINRMVLQADKRGLGLYGDWMISLLWSVVVEASYDHLWEDITVRRASFRGMQCSLPSGIDVSSGDNPLRKTGFQKKL